MNKVFSLFLMVALILGGSLGGAFAGGVALGKTQGDDSSEAQRAGNFSQGQGGRSGSERRGQGAGSGGGFQRGGQGAGPGGGGQQRFGQRGTDSRETRADDERRQGLEGRGETREGAEGGGRRGRRGVGGAIESVDGTTLTITTPRGPVIVNTDDETIVRKVVDGSKEDLKQGVQIRVTGARDKVGTVKATSITLVPEGAQEFFGRRGQKQER